MRFPALFFVAILGLLEPVLSIEAQDKDSPSTRDIDNALLAIESRELVEDIWSTVKDATTCAGCQVRVATGIELIAKLTSSLSLSLFWYYSKAWLPSATKRLCALFRTSARFLG